MEAFLEAAKRQGCLVEASVMVKYLSLPCSIFYTRARTDIVRNASLLHSHPYGELFTFLNIFRKWSELKPRGHKEWCMQNGLDNQVLVSLSKSVKEISHDQDGLQRDTEWTDLKVKRLILDNIKGCYSVYLGHQKLGYVSLEDEKTRVPESSSVILSEVSRYIYSITTESEYTVHIPLLESEILERFPSAGKIVKDIVCHEHVLQYPPSVIAQLLSRHRVGEATLEDALEQLCDQKPCSVNLNVKFGIIKLYVNSNFVDRVKNYLDSLCEEIKDKLKQQTTVLCYPSVDSPIRVMIKNGASLAGVCDPYEERTLIIKKYLGTGGSHNELTEQEMRESMSKFGEIQAMKVVEKSDAEQSDVYQNYQSRNRYSTWMKITFKTAVEADVAKHHIDNHMVSVNAQIAKPGKGNGGSCGAQGDWCLCLDTAACGSLVKKVTARLKFGDSCYNHSWHGRRLFIGDNKLKINRGKSEDELYFTGFSPHTSLMTDQDIADSLKNSFTVPVDNVQIEREQARRTMHRHSIRGHISGKLRSYIQNFWVTAEESAPGKFSCKIKTMDVEAGLNFLTSHRDIFVANNPQLWQVVAQGPPYVALELKKSVYEVVRDGIALVAATASRICKGNATVDVVEGTNDSVTIRIIGCSFRYYNILKRSVSKVVTPVVTHMEREALNILTSPTGATFIDRLQCEMNVAVIIDKRFGLSKVYGEPGSKADVVEKLNMYTEAILRKKQEWKIVSFPSFDASSIKIMFHHLVKLYGVNLHKLRTIIGASAINIDTGKQVLRVRGNYSTIALRKIIDRIMDVNHNEKEGESCHWCLCPVPEDDIYRLGLCGHVYCMDCFVVHVTAAVNSRSFPITCAADGCAEPLLMWDIDRAIQMSDVSKEKLLSMAVKDFVSKHPDKIKYCISENCPGIYSAKRSHRKHVCQLCDVAICTGCYKSYHEGASCVVGQVTETLNPEMQGWMASDLRLHKVCGRCKVLIEKNGGCPHVVCGNCGVSICWICLETSKFPNELETHIATHTPEERMAAGY